MKQILNTNFITYVYSFKNFDSFLNNANKDGCGCL